MKQLTYLLLAFTLISLFACENAADNEKKLKQSKLEGIIMKEQDNQQKLDKLNKNYPDIPDDKILDYAGEKSPLYAELKARYKDYCVKLKQEIEGTGAKFVMVIISPEVGKSISNQNTFGIPYIKQVCNELGIELYDFSPAIAQKDLKKITQTPKDGHWSKAGAVFLANEISPIIKKHETNKATTTYKDTERPETFGDLPPNDDEFLDGGKDLPYHLQANSQGLRMGYDLKFPKTKFRVLMMGGSQFFSPFLDNEFISSSVLQKEFPNYEIVNAAMISSSVDDYLSLFEEKVKFIEPDLVILQTNGGDITDLYFSNRNHLGRSHTPHYPTKNEEDFYTKRYSKK